MRPYIHARVSARKTGRDWQDDLRVHEFIDSSKVAVPDLRHRLALHSVDFGAKVAARAFPDLEHIGDLVRCHVREDLGEERTLSGWLRHLDAARLPRFYPKALPIDWARLAEDEAARQKLAEPTGPLAVGEVLRLPLALVPDFGEPALAITCNAFGVGLIRQIFGPPRLERKDSGGETIFDPSLAAESMIFTLYKNIPSLADVTGALRFSYQERTA